MPLRDTSLPTLQISFQPQLGLHLLKNDLALEKKLKRNRNWNQINRLLVNEGFTFSFRSFALAAAAALVVFSIGAPRGVSLLLLNSMES